MIRGSYGVLGTSLSLGLTFPNYRRGPRMTWERGICQFHPSLPLQNRVTRRHFS